MCLSPNTELYYTKDIRTDSGHVRFSTEGKAVDGRVRRALLLASIGRYLVMAINIFTAIIMARLLTPKEYGFSVLGAAVYAIAEAIRDLGSGSYLVRQEKLSAGKIRTTFTVNLIVTLTTATIIMLLTGTIARYYGAPELELYLQVITASYVTGPFVYPTLALMFREMAFGTIAFINVLTALLNAAATIFLAVLGFSYMSFAWAGFISATTAIFLVFHFRRDWSMFRLSLSDWRGVLAFGAYNSATSLVFQMWDYLPFLIFGKLLNAEAVGLWQRAMWVCLFPEKVILTGIGAVALPVFSQRVREGRNLKDSYLSAIEHITAVQWPALILIALLPYPIVSMLLGRQWLGAVPLVHIIAGALLFYFPVGLSYPTLVAVGAIRNMFLLFLMQATVSIAVLWSAATYGLQTAALSLFLTVPFNVLVSVLIARLHVPFRWVELAASMRKSAMLSALSAAGPLLIVIRRGADMSIGPAIVAVILCAVGWLGGLWITRHPLLDELFRARDLPWQSIVARGLSATIRLFISWR